MALTEAVDLASAAASKRTANAMSPEERLEKRTADQKRRREQQREAERQAREQEKDGREDTWRAIVIVSKTM